MSENENRRDSLIGEFTENYMEKLFYFCLKKTSCDTEAEDLSQDIAMHILTALDKGTVPAHFSAWVWQIARNRYTAWAQKKHLRAKSVSASDIGDYEIECEDENTLDVMIYREQLALLKRELAFIKRDYREIVVAYYIENRSIRDIASLLTLSQEAVKKRLQRARNILKKGMTMAREYGKRSYVPEEIHFSNHCASFGDNGQPWSVLSHAMYKNIFLEAYGNPSTAEDLSLALGIALPYMEDELEYLTRETFLIKNGDKYETSFPIISREAQKKIRSYNHTVTEKITPLLETLVDDYAAACETHGIPFYGTHQCYADAKWTLLMCTFDNLMSETEDCLTRTERPDNGKWDIIGYEQTDLSDPPDVNKHGCNWDDTDHAPVHMYQYKFRYRGIEDKTPRFLSYEEAWTLKQVANGKSVECETRLIKKLLEYGYIRQNGEEYEVTTVVFDKKDADRCRETFTDEENESISTTAREIRRILGDATAFSSKVTGEDLPPLFKNDKKSRTLASNANKLRRESILQQALSDAWLKYDENTSDVIGAYLYL